MLGEADIQNQKQCQACVKWRAYANSQKETELRVKEAEELNAQWKEYADTLKAQLDENADNYTQEVGFT